MDDSTIAPTADTPQHTTTPRTDKNCKGCQQPITQRSGDGNAHYERRTYCSRACRDKRPKGGAAAVVFHDNRMEDLMWLLDGGESPEQIPARIGTNAHALEKWLLRYGYHDLAKLFRPTTANRAA